MNYEAFTTVSHSLLIAPAGHGKTHTISECLKHTVGKQLILTHTHAGVASIKEKLKKSAIPSATFQVETITSFAQKYVLAFHVDQEAPSQEDSQAYYSFIIKRAIELFSRKPIYNIFQNTYFGLFVDEYQDCTKSQHELIKILAKGLPTRILGDPLQGIFDFHNEGLVDLDDKEVMGDFSKNMFSLQQPYRWMNGNNEVLGQELKTIRNRLIALEAIDMSTFKGLEYVVAAPQDLYNINSEYFKKLKALVKEESLLILHPDSTSVNPRLKVIQRFSVPIALLESIDDKTFYELARQFDDLQAGAAYKPLLAIIKLLFNKTVINLWFNENGFKNKTSAEDKAHSAIIRDQFNKCNFPYEFHLFSELLHFIHGLPGMKVYRKEVFRTLCRALELASYEKISVYEAMMKQRNVIRRVGRKVIGRCIGTTLLTKGLEFDTVVVLNAHKYNSPKHLYVALSRASKRLVIFGESAVLNPYG